MSLEDQIVAEFKDLAKGVRLKPREREIVAEIASDAAQLQANAMSGLWDEGTVKREKAQLNAQLAALKSIGGARAVKLFWQAFNIAVGVITKAVVAL